MPSFPGSSSASHAARGVRSALLKAVASADDHAVALALQLATDADVNAADHAGRTVLGMAIAGDRWEDADASDASFKLEKRLAILKMLLQHGGLTLYSLNAPQDFLHGATPLGMAAWLNLPEAAQLFLEECQGLVVVDGMDTRGATPLMYAARDGNVQVVQYLLAHGARPDYRDIHHRTAIQHALRHPQALWLCESALRRHRAQESITKGNTRNLCHLYPELDESLAATETFNPHPRFSSPISTQELLNKATILVSAILSQDIHQLDYLLFPAASSSSSSSKSLPEDPFLINYPDEQGWSPIHHCVSATNPSFTVLDTLYRAGADMSLYTRSGHGTALHCLAYKAKASIASIGPFIHHLVHDLRAPLSAADQQGETCMHIAAEHGHSIEVLSAFLACDTTGTVREMRNSRGLTAYEVAQPRFKVAFGLPSELPRAGSSASVRTIKPSTSSVESASSLPIANVPIASPSTKESHDETLALDVLENLQSISRELSETAGDLDVSAARSLLHQTFHMGEGFLLQMQSRAQDAILEVGATRRRYQQVASTLDRAIRTLDAEHEERFSALERAWKGGSFVRSYTMDSTFSDGTAVSSLESDTSSMILVTKEVKMVDVAVSAIPVPALSVDIHDNSDDAYDPFPATNPSTPSRPDQVHRSLRPVKSMTDIRLPSTPSGEDRGFFGLVSPWVKGLPRKRSRSDLTSNRPAQNKWAGQVSIEESVKSSTAKVRAWFKKKLMPDAPVRLIIVRALDEAHCSVGREVKADIKRAYTEARTLSSSRPPQNTSKLMSGAVAAASKDLTKIRECTESADRYLKLATRSIKQANRLLQTAVQEREASLDAAHFIQQHLASDVDAMASLPVSVQSTSRKGSVEFLPVTIPSSPRNSQLIFPRPPESAASSLSSFSITSEEDDEDVRALRKLLTWKIYARIEGALDECEKAVTWMRIVRDVMRGVPRTT